MSLVEGDERIACRSESFGRSFRCPDGTHVFGEMTHVIREVAMGWSVPAPGLAIEPGSGRMVEIRLPLRLEGTYYASCYPRCNAELLAGGETHSFGGGTERLVVTSGDERSVVLRIQLNGRSAVAVVRESAIDVDRTTDVEWAPAEPP